MMIPVDQLSETFPDLEPCPQDDGPEPVCVIQYPTAFRLAYDYMRAVWKVDELSERSLKLTALCLKLNPANYTVWHFRRKCKLTACSVKYRHILQIALTICLLFLAAVIGLRHLELNSKEDMLNDLKLSASLGGDNPKNYQIWYHRRTLLETYPNLKQDFLESELNYISTVFEEDSKNYHAWSHRQWFVNTINDEDVWKREIEFSEKLIQEDPRNNSAWNQRWFACHRGLKDALPLETSKTEADFALDTGAAVDPFNESPWRYLVSLLREQYKQKTLSVELLKEFEEKSTGLRKVLVDAGREPDTCSNLTSARIDLLEMIGDQASLEKVSKALYLVLFRKLVPVSYQ